MESEKFTETEQKTENREEKKRADRGEIGTEYQRVAGSVHRRRMNQTEEMNVGRKEYGDA